MTFSIILNPIIFTHNIYEKLVKDSIYNKNNFLSITNQKKIQIEKKKKLFKYCSFVIKNLFKDKLLSTFP